MASSDLFMLVSGALPLDFDPEKLKCYGSAESWGMAPREALVFALKQCAEIDWEQYLALNLDVKEAGIDPVLHFLEHGVFEGRKLCTRQLVSDQGESSFELPISIVIVNYNNALYLRHAVGSALGQSLREIEILVIDDGSTDSSQEALKSLRGSDSRLKLARFKTRQSPHIARISGMLAAKGRYLLFMDADDFLAPDACEHAFALARKGHDLVSLGIAPVFPADFPGEEQERALRSLNPTLSRDASAASLKAPIVEAGFLGGIAGKLVSAELCRRVLVKMEFRKLYLGEDSYEWFVLASMARNPAILEESLYFHRVGKTRHNLGAASSEEIKTLSEAFHCVRRHCEAVGGMENIAQVRQSFLNRSLKHWLTSNSKDSDALLDDILTQYGRAETLDCMDKEHSKDLLKIALRIKEYAPKFSRETPIRTIGLLYGTLYDGGAERIVWEQANELAARGYKVVVFLERAHVNDERLKAPIRVAYLSGSTSKADRLLNHIRGLERALQENQVDVMLCHACYEEKLLWQTILLKYLALPVIYFSHSAFYSRLVREPDTFTQQIRDAILACGDAVSVLSPYEEIYFHSIGVNARYIPNPVRLPDPGWVPPSFAQRKDNLLVFSRLGEPTKNITDCLYILKEVSKSRPRARMRFLGSFANERAREIFYKLVSQLGLSEKVEVTGWVEDTTPFIDSAAVLVSASLTESFALTIAESQARGLPAVMYDLPLAIIDQSEGITVGPRGNIAHAARSIVAILENEKLWNEKSVIARKKIAKYSHQKYMDNVISMLNDFRTQSHIHYHTPKEYLRVISSFEMIGADLPVNLRANAI